MKETDKILLGGRIASIRDLHGLTLEEFGKKIDNATKSNVSKWEKGTVIPNRKRLQMIADLAGIHVNQLKYGEYGRFVVRMFLQEYEKFKKRYENMPDGYLILSTFDFNGCIASFQEWAEENKDNIDYDDKKMKSKANELIYEWASKSAMSPKESNESSINKVIKSYRRILIELENDYYYGYENESGEVERKIREGMDPEIFRTAESIISNSIKQLELLKDMIS